MVEGVIIMYESFSSNEKNVLLIKYTKTTSTRRMYQRCSRFFITFDAAQAPAFAPKTAAVDFIKTKIESGVSLLRGRSRSVRVTSNVFHITEILILCVIRSAGRESYNA